ncbi:MAG TPA: hypothetical protein EYN51_06395 [Flavobacteriales bacterium]|nr:hypothetical protein [Flavobacteriales bacterium]
MSVFIKGADIQGVDDAKIDSIVPGAVITVSTLLVAGTHREKYYDPTGGAIILTLPVPADGVRFFIKRVANVANPITVTGQTIDGVAGDLVLGVVNQFVELVGNAALNTYHIVNQQAGAYGSLRRDSDSDFSVNGTFQKYTDFESIVFSTPGRIVANLAADQLDILNLRPDPVKLVTISFNMTFIGTQGDNPLAVQIVHSTQGVIIPEQATVTRGNNDDVNLSFSIPVLLTANGNLSVELREIANVGTLTIRQLEFSASVNR